MPGMKFLNNRELERNNERLAEESGFHLTATHLLEYLFCPRFSYFEYVLNIPEHQEKRFKVRKGREIHEKIGKRNIGYLRKKLGVVEKKLGVYLSSPFGIRGIVDEILFLSDGSAAPLDYKYAEYKEKTFKNHKYQLTFYGKLIMDNYGVPVKKGYIVYTRSKNRLIEVRISENMYRELEKIILEMLNVIQRGFYPPATRYKARCTDCCYKNICESAI